MTASQPPVRRKRYFRVTIIVGAILFISILGLHIWFVNNARNVLKQIVHDKSQGKLKLELSQLRFEFLTNQLQVREADLVSIDSTTQPLTYHVRFNRLTLHVGSFWPLLFQKKLILDSILLADPQVEVFQWRKDTTLAVRNELSLPQQMGKLYNSMLDGLEVFGIRRIQIANARLSLVNKMAPGAEPVAVSNIHFNLLRKAAEKGRRDAFIAGEQEVDLRTTDQQIALPGGRHRLAFKSFQLELFQKRIVLDSCTVTALPTDSSRSSYQVFFNRLLLKGVDFDAMYRRNLIRADSVYCENPAFDINIDRGDATARKKEKRDLDQMIRDLTGDLDLAFVGVKDAGIRIDIIGGRSQSLFNSNKDDFEMRGLRINADSSRPVVVEQFDMLVQDYHLFSRDSSSAYSFDSIHFSNNKIVLNNFTVATQNTRFNRTRNRRDFRIPYFELTGLDWYGLIFEETLQAREAVLVNPVIRYVQNQPPARRKKRTNVFASLQTLDDLITLGRIQVVNGQINMQLGPSTAFDLQNVHLGLYTNRLLGSTDQAGLRSAVERLSFSGGRFRMKDLSARLQNVRYTGSNLIQADRLLVDSRKNNIKATVNSVSLRDLVLDEEAGSMVVDGLRWQSATVAVNAAPAKGGRAKGGSLQLKNIAGSNTRFRFSNGKATVSTLLQSVRLDALIRNGSGPLRVEGLSVSGRQLDVANGPLQVKAATYQVNGGAPSFITGLQLARIQDRDSLLVKAPRINFAADINSLLAKDLHLTSVEAISPDITFRKWAAAAPPPAGGGQAALRVDRITVREPVVSIATHRNDSTTRINIPLSANSAITASGLTFNNDGLRIGGFALQTTAATLVKATGETIGVEKGKVDLELSDISLARGGEKPAWSALINNLYLQNPNTLALGKSKNRLLLQQASVGNVRLSSAYLSNFDQLVKYNVSAWLRTATGQYTDSTTTLKWYNAGYNRQTNTLSLDSFTYYPTQPLDSVIAHTPHQTDYITFHSGAVKMTDFDLERYNRDSALLASNISITNPVITIFRDKQPPFLSGNIKPLPVVMIRSIGLPVGVQQVNIVDGTLRYTERHAKTRAEGTLVLDRMNGRLQNIKNRNFGPTDSLTLTLNAYLMDSALLNLRVRESYTDSLNGFLMTLRMRPTTLSFLNPVLAPLSNVIISSGTIDSFHLRAIGNDELSFGAMNMYYHDLRIKLVKDGEEGKSTFLTRAASWLANALVIRKNNNGRTGLVYFERLRDRSFFNYLIKMTFSGMATSVGVKKNRKYVKQYRKALKERELPPLDFE